MKQIDHLTSSSAGIIKFKLLRANKITNSFGEVSYARRDSPEPVECAKYYLIVYWRIS